MKRIITLIIILLITSCKTQKNVETKNSKAEIILEKTINEFNPKDQDDNKLMNCSFAIAPNEHYYFTSKSRKGLIKEYDQNGKFIRIFSLKGSGPGEAEYYTDIFNIEETIYAFCPPQQRINIFNLNGDFIKSLPTKGLIRIVKASDNRLVAIKEKREIISKSDNIFNMKNTIILYDSTLSYISTICEKTEKFKLKIGSNIRGKFYPYICANKQNIYVSWISNNEYKIFAYNSSDGSESYTINKNVRKLYYNDSEMAFFSELNGFDMKQKFGQIPKKIINAIKCDKNNYLWVLSARKRLPNNEGILYADIYNKGKFMKTISLPEIYFRDGTWSYECYKIIFMRNKLIYCNTLKENEEYGKQIKIYDYSL